MEGGGDDADQEAGGQGETGDCQQERQTAPGSEGMRGGRDAVALVPYAIFLWPSLFAIWV